MLHPAPNPPMHLNIPGTAGTLQIGAGLLRTPVHGYATIGGAGHTAQSQAAWSPIPSRWCRESWTSSAPCRAARPAVGCLPHWYLSGKKELMLRKSIAVGCIQHWCLSWKQELLLRSLIAVGCIQH